MGITQKNSYGENSDLSNLSENVDLNRLNDDKSFLTVSFAGSPATATIKVGSVIEVNGNVYAIDTADETHLFTSATDNYLGFNGTSFSNHAGRGTWDTAKQGYYQTGGLIRTLKWYINQDDDEYHIDSEIKEGYFIDSNVISKTKVIEIGDWNMDSTDQVSVAHGLALSQTRGVKALIRDDNDQFRHDLFTKANVISGRIDIDSTDVLLTRKVGGGFDNNLFDSTSYNRGWITIDYVP